MKKKHRILNLIIALLLIAAIICGVLYFLEYRKNAADDASVESMTALKPDVPDPPEDNLMDFTALWAQNKDIIAWVTVPDTVIDYPVTQSGDNDYYLRRNLDEEYSRNGTPFLDYRVRSDFSDFSSVIYGHYMATGLMFQNLSKFKEKDFFDAHPTFTLYTPKKTFNPEVFAVAVVNPNSELYKYAFFSNSEKRAHLELLKQEAVFYRELDVTQDDCIVILSTCSYEYQDARTIVAARLPE